MALSGCAPGEIPYPEAGPAPGGAEVGANIVCPSGTAEMQSQVLATRCAGAGCHGSSMSALGLDLVSSGLEARLVNVPSIGCRGERLVVPGQPEQSELYRKVAHATPECGVRMPVGSAFNDAEIECLRRWIASLPGGAPDAGAGGDAASDRPAADLGAICPAGQQPCGGRCVSLQDDNGNCGACGRVCAPGSSCSAGSCACPGGQQLCGQRCTDVTRDNLNCGVCGRTCGGGQSCVGGACACNGGLTSCGGACVDLASNAANCGACGKPCSAGSVCAGGSCVRGGCPAGTATCDGACVDTQVSALNCGGCGITCAAGQSCTSGACSCAAGTSLCGGACVNSASDPWNCGGCGRTCPAGSACSGGSCGCASGQTLCGSSCVNTASDSGNCGGCGKACSGGASCVGGVCGTTCAPGTTLCSGSCVNTASDTRHCGGCGQACGAGESCTGGVCVGCGPTVSFANQVQPIFNASCTSNCHGGNRPAGGVSLAAGVAHAEIVNVTSSCRGLKQVAPGAPGSSYLINKLTGVGMCSGSVMPKMGGELSAAQIDLIRAWICQGAPKN
jgi:hypothetical protein